MCGNRHGKHPRGGGGKAPCGLAPGSSHTREDTALELAEPAAELLVEGSPWQLLITKEAS